MVDQNPRDAGDVNPMINPPKAGANFETPTDKTGVAISPEPSLQANAVKPELPKP